jgi:hypothetical protein
MSTIPYHHHDEFTFSEQLYDDRLAALRTLRRALLEKLEDTRLRGRLDLGLLVEVVQTAHGARAELEEIISELEACQLEFYRFQVDEDAWEIKLPAEAPDYIHEAESCHRAAQHAKREWHWLGERAATARTSACTPWIGEPTGFVA